MSKNQPLTNASEIIERFGGIRPMAAKIDTPVTTVQGWKKRDVIPANRRDQIMSAAADHNIDLSDVANGSANENVSKATPPKPDVKKEEPKSELPKAKVQDKADTKGEEAPIVIPEAPVPKTPDVDQKAKENHSPKSGANQDEILAAIEANNRKTIKTSIWTTVVLILIAAVIMFVFFGSKLGGTNQTAAQIELLKQENENLKAEVENVSERTSFISNIMPDGIEEGLQERMNGLQNQARNIQITVDQLAERADEISSEISSSVLGPDAGPLALRLEMLEEKMASFANIGNLGSLVERIGTLEGTMIGQDQLRASVAELQDIVTNMDRSGEGESLNENLEDVQNNEDGSALSQTLQGVSGNDLKAAAMLITFSQLRDSLNREAPFKNDLILLDRLVDEDNVELKGAIVRLAPHADGGVLTAKGLSGEFKGLAGDILEASLKGEDLSIMDRAKGRLGNLMSVEKDGELIGATPTQEAVNRAQKLLDAGNIKGAIAELETLDGPAADQARPFIDQAKISLLSERVQELMGENILSTIANQIPQMNALGANLADDQIERGFSDLMPSLENPENFNLDAVKRTLEEAVPNMGGQEVITDEESGVTILPKQQGFKGFSSGAKPTN